jgi:hypothetical protein
MTFDDVAYVTTTIASLAAWLLAGAVLLAFVIRAYTHR